VVFQFKYLGSVFNSDCTLDAELTHRVTAANSAFQQLSQVNIWSSRALTLFVKMQFFQCIVMSVLLYSGETWAVVKQHISPLAVFQMNCLRRICGISLCDHVPNVDILIDCLRSYCLVNLRGSAHLVAPGLVSIMFLCMIVKPVRLVDRIEMRKTDCFGKTRLVPHLPSSS